MRQADLVLLHPPSVYDFRKEAIMYGPVSDLIPSSPVFEMYPLGFLTITSYLEDRGYRVRIINLALRMMNDRSFDVPKFLMKLRPLAFGIDLHWLPHAQGSLEIAHILKELHPDIPVIFGGLSATYFHEELIKYPQVDYVLRGDSVEPPLYELLRCLEGKKPNKELMAKIPNLTWKEDGSVRVNPLSFVPESLDYADLRPDLIIKMVARYHDLKSILPFNDWWGNPIMPIFTVKGCAHECATCGSSKSACKIVTGRLRPAYRSPQSVIKNMLEISKFSKGPIFLIGDLRQPGEDYAKSLLKLLKAARIKNEIIFEFFDVAPKDFLDEINSSVENWSLEISPESHDPKIRRIFDPTACHSNEEMEEMLDHALELNCHRVDVFFMIGLPQQTYQSVMETIDYCERLFERFDKKLSCFISPMGPFLDPGSRVFEMPEAYGYKLFTRTLEEHRQRLTRPSWKHILSYETAWMSRDELVEATYEAAERLNQLKLEHGRINKDTAMEVARNIKQAKELKMQLDRYEGEVNADPPEALQGEIRRFSMSTICEKRELYWPAHWINFKPLGTLRMLLKRR